jgi:hypothetical protein
MASTELDITTLTGLMIEPLDPTQIQGFYVPSLTAAQIAMINPNELRSGVIIFNNTTGTYQIYNAQNTWLNINASPVTATGIGLTSGVPFIYPSGTAAAVEVAANQVNGFVYYNTTNNTLRGYINGAWAAI